MGWVLPLETIELRAQAYIYIYEFTERFIGSGVLD
jgi:hypothetical protein